MIVCSRCGFQNEDSDTFCGSCASFLEWEGQKVAAEAEPEPEPEPEEQPEARIGIIDRVKEVIGLGDDGPSSGTANGHATATAGEEAAEEGGSEPETVAPGAVSAPVIGGALSGMAGTAAPAAPPAAPAPAQPPGTPVGGVLAGLQAALRGKNRVLWLALGGGGAVLAVELRPAHGAACTRFARVVHLRAGPAEGSWTVGCAVARGSSSLPEK